MAKLNMSKFDEATKRLIQFAKEAGWVPSLTNSGHIRFDKPNKPAVYFSSSTSDRRAALNCKSKLRHADNLTGRYANG